MTARIFEQTKSYSSTKLKAPNLIDFGCGYFSVSNFILLCDGYIRLNSNRNIITTFLSKLVMEYFPIHEGVQHGHCLKQGMRPRMENRVVVHHTFNVFDSKCTSGYMSLYAVFDGHGGEQCSKYCAIYFAEILEEYLITSSSVTDAFHSTISKLDQKVIKMAEDASGSTCCVILIDYKTHELWCCNIGDSRCIVINKTYTKVKQLSIEHKPDYPLEKQRIESANGWVTFGRVCGILSVSRSLGDKDFKYEIENVIISTPDVTHHKIIANEDKYIILASVGLYDVYTNEQCMEWLNKNINESYNNASMQEIAEKLCDDAIYVRRLRSDVSIIIVKIEFNEVEYGDSEINDFDESK